MSAKAISEQTGKELLYKYICTTSAIQNRFKYARVTPDTDWARLLQDHPWLLSQVSPPHPGPFTQAQSPRKRKQSVCWRCPTGSRDGRLPASVGSVQWAEQGSVFSSLHVEVPWHGTPSMGLDWTHESKWQFSFIKHNGHNTHPVSCKN